MALVAVVDGEVVGHVMVRNAVLRSNDRDRQISMLSPLAVRPDCQKAGIGHALVSAALAVADERGEPLVVVEGSPAYYGRFGFEHSIACGIEIDLPEWAPPEAAQVRRLRSFDPDDANTPRQGDLSEGLRRSGVVSGATADRMERIRCSVPSVPSQPIFTSISPATDRS